MAVIFDMDGVLADSNAAHLLAFQSLGREIGVPFTEELLAKTFGMHNNQIFKIWLGDDIDSAKIRELSLKKEQMYRDVAIQSLQPIPGAVSLVERCFEAGFRCAIGSSGPRANVELAIWRLGLGDRISTVVSGDDVENGKPDPEIFLRALKGLEVEADSCLVIEDAPQGVQAAIAAKMQVIAVTTSRPAEFLKEATLVVQSLDEIQTATIKKYLSSFPV